LLDLLIIPLHALHLLCVNVAAGGPLVCLWLESKEGRGDLLAGRAANYLGAAAWWTLLAGAGLGVAIGSLQWSEAYAELWTITMWKKVAWGIGEYGFSFLLASMYVLWRNYGTRRLRWLRLAVLLLNGTNLLYHFPFLFSVASSIQVAAKPVSPLTPAEFRQWMLHQDVLARVVHVVLASIAVAGVMLLGLAMRLKRLGATADEETRVARWGGWIALAPTLAQIPVGLWLITALPAPWQSRVLGGDVAAMVLLGVSVVLTVLLLQDLAAIALGDVQRKFLVRSMLLTVLIVLLMTGVLHRMRPERESTDIVALTLRVRNCVFASGCPYRTNAFISRSEMATISRSQ